jgi:hypothetical protein
MKSIYLSFVFISFLLFFSCKNQPESKFEFTHKENNLSFSKCIAIQWKDTLKNNFVPFDSTVEMQFIGCSGFKLFDGKAFVGASMILADSLDNILFQNKDLFIDYDTVGFEPNLVKERVGIFLVTGHPMKKGGTYKWTAKIWDKKGNGKIEAIAFITVK